MAQDSKKYRNSELQIDHGKFVLVANSLSN